MPKFFKKSDDNNDDINPKEMEKILNKSSVVSHGTGKKLSLCGFTSYP